ncbi:hypothetical protein [Streptomyces sp. NPDC049916]|uniref:hypothetical protein n=1 Tax=Streptomyces sp. NPDC049916 TaxID=3155156 RepID=UPI00342CC92A
MITLVREGPTGRSAGYDEGGIAHKAWLGHTQHCATCRTGVSCPTAAKLGRAWREARR